MEAFVGYISLYTVLQNTYSSSAGAPPDFFQGRGGFVEVRHFGKHFVKNTRKKGPQGKIWGFFLLDTLKTTF